MTAVLFLSAFVRLRRVSPNPPKADSDATAAKLWSFTFPDDKFLL
jgi:hypothetical protein